jgi:hypothetical protein
MSELLHSLETAKKQIVQIADEAITSIMQRRSFLQQLFLIMIELDLSDIELCLEYDRPYTIANMSWSPKTGQHAGQVFVVRQRAKVSWPDEWDRERGAEIATKRAIRALADKVVAYESLEKNTEIAPVA